MVTLKRTQILTLTLIRTLHVTLTSYALPYNRTDSGNTAFFASDAMVHRHGGWYMSVRMKSLRSMGNEDFEKTPKAWHSGAGMLQARVYGDEYDQTRARMDWNVLPGVTEEWRSDSIPGTQKSNVCGGSAFAATASDGVLGAAAFEHLPHPLEELGYSVAGALKGYFFSATGVVALGNSIKRVKAGKPVGSQSVALQRINRMRQFPVEKDAQEHCMQKVPTKSRSFARKLYRHGRSHRHHAGPDPIPGGHHPPGRERRPDGAALPLPRRLRDQRRHRSRRGGVASPGQVALC